MMLRATMKRILGPERHYPAPSAAAAHIKDRVAFWRGVEVEPATGA
jgi:hypothetical protein